MLEKIRRFIAAEGLLSPGARVVVGFSGGADSVCLLEALRLLAPELSLTLFALHVHHGIRGGEADGDAAFAAGFCEKRGIPLRTVCRDIPAEARQKGLGLEEAGRLARREELARMVREVSADRAALAHHKNDLAETMLFQLARGTGLAGLSGISPSNGIFVRPLLCVTRAEIETWLRGRRLSWREDSTNADTAYARNRLRHRVLPELTRVNAQAVTHMAEASAELREVCGYLESLLPDKWDRCAAKTPEGILLSAGELLAEPPLFQRMLIREAFRRLGGLRDLGKVHVEAVRDLLRGAKGRRRDLPGMAALRSGEGVLLTAARGEAISGPERSRELPEEGVRLRIPGVTVYGGWRFTAELLHMPEENSAGNPDASMPWKLENDYTKWFDYAKIRKSIFLRGRMRGDYLVIHPDGRRKTISNLFTDRKVPRGERDGVVMLAAGPEILWAVGIRSGESARIDGESRELLRVSAERTV